MLVGLQYVGNSKGLSVMLYKSYKSVDVSWDRPYTFTPRDIVNDDAKKYYLRNYSPLGIKIVEDNTILPELDKKVTAPVEESTPVEVEEVVQPVEVEETTDKQEEEVVEPVNEEVTTSSNNDLTKIFSDIKSEYDAETITSLSEGDLASLLDQKLDDEQVKCLADEVGYSIGRAKNKSKIISGLASSKLDEVVKLILS